METDLVLAYDELDYRRYQDAGDEQGPHMPQPGAIQRALGQAVLLVGTMWRGIPQTRAALCMERLELWEVCFQNAQSMNC
jgi:hypothetical protein